MNLAQGGSDPRSQILQALAQPQATPQQAQQAQPVPQQAAPDVSPPQMLPVQGQPGATVPVPLPRPAGMTDDSGNITPEATKQFQANNAVPPPQQPVPGGGTPPDLTQMYEKLMDKQRSYDLIDSGARMAVAAYSTPTMANALMRGASSGSQTSPGDALKTMLALQGMQQANQLKKVQQARLPAIADKYFGGDMNLTSQLYEGGKLDELLSKVATPDTQVVTNAAGQSALLDKRKNTIALPTGNESANPVKTDKPAEWAAKQADIDANPQKYGLDPTKPDFATKRADLMLKAAVPGGPQINVNNTPEGPYSTEMAKIWAKAQGADAAKGDTALSLHRNLSTMEDAANAPGSADIYYGPGSDNALKLKEAYKGITGNDWDGSVAPAEAIRMAGVNVALQAAKAANTRFTQREFGVIQDAKPGTQMSREGMLANINIMKQQAALDQGVAALANQPWKSAAEYNAAKAAYINDPANRLVSPFTGGQFGKEDVQRLNQLNTDASFVEPPSQAVSILRNNPDANTRAHFDAEFGPGASRKVLGQ
jgi:hypothetical protein